MPAPACLEAWIANGGKSPFGPDGRTNVTPFCHVLRAYNEDDNTYTICGERLMRPSRNEAAVTLGNCVLQAPPAEQENAQA